MDITVVVTGGKNREGYKRDVGPPNMCRFVAIECTWNSISVFPIETVTNTPLSCSNCRHKRKNT